MTPKQKKFCDEYLIDLNATQAAIRAGYSAGSAGRNADRMMKNEEIKAYLAEQMEKMHKETIASAEEILEFLTKGVRQELEEEVLMIEGVGNGFTETVKRTKKISLKEAIRCAELIGKRYALFTDKTQIDGVIPVVILGGDELEE